MAKDMNLITLKYNIYNNLKEFPKFIKSEWKIKISYLDCSVIFHNEHSNGRAQ